MSDAPLTVMTWNLYLGADVGPVLQASPETLSARWRDLYEMLRATDFAARARGLAQHIAAARPDALFLQEVYRWTLVSRPPLASGPPTTRVLYDFLDLLQAELSALGLEYFTASRRSGVDVQLPMLEGPDLRMEDSVALLLRVGADTPLQAWSRPQGGGFATTLQAKLGGEPFPIARGWASADVQLSSGPLRLLTTHLEYYGEGVRPGQVEELLAGPLAGERPAILAGDFNAKPGTPIAQRLAAAGFSDAWELGGGGEGYSSSQDEALVGAASQLYERIDWILLRGPIQVLEVDRVGHRPRDRTPEGLWPSDHAGVVARLRVGSGA